MAVFIREAESKKRLTPLCIDEFEALKAFFNRDPKVYIRPLAGTFAHESEPETWLKYEYKTVREG